MRKHRQMKNLGLIISVSVVTLLFLVGASMAQGVSMKTLKVGGLFSLSGPASQWGVGWRGGVEIGVEWVNEKGIRVGKDVYKIELIVEDDKFGAEGGKQAYEKLVYKDGVKFIFGPWSSVAAMAGIPVVEENKVLNLCGSYGLKVLSPNYKYIWRPLITGGEIYGALAAWVKGKYPEAKRVAVIGQNNEYGWTCNADVEMNFKRNGIETVANVYHEPKLMDYYTILGNMLAKKPDLIASNSVGSEMAMQIKQAKELGFKGLFMGPAPASIDIWEGIVGKEALEGYFDNTPSFGPNASKQLQKLRQDYIAKFRTFNPSCATSINYPLIFKEIIEKAQSLDPSEIIKTLPGSTYEVVDGKGYWGGKARYGTAQNLIYPTSISLYTKGEMVFQGFFPTPEPLTPAVRSK